MPSLPHTIPRLPPQMSDFSLNPPSSPKGVSSSLLSSEGMSFPPPNPVTPLFTHYPESVVWGGFFGVFILLFLLSFITRKLERRCTPLLHQLRTFSPVVIRIFTGIAVLGFGSHSAFLGAEIPLTLLWPAPLAYLVSALQISGWLLIVGLFVRSVSIFFLCIFCILAFRFSSHMAIYAFGCGTFLSLFLLGAPKFSLEHLLRKLAPRSHMPLLGWRKGMTAKFGKFTPLILRVSLGFSFITLALYAHAIPGDPARLLALALTPVSSTQHFLSPSFILLEVLLGVFLLVGYEIRLTSILFGTLILSVFHPTYTDFWTHILALGVLVAVFMNGHDKYSFEGRFFKRI